MPRYPEIPENERDIYDCIVANWAQVAVFLRDFQTACALFELLERGGNPQNGVLGGVFVKYRIIAAREAALNVYHFGCTIDSIRDLLAKTTVLKARFIDPKLVRIAHKAFRAQFPNVTNIRHAIAHAGEFFDSVDRMKSHERKSNIEFHGSGAGGGGFFKEALFERTYSIGFEGAILSISIDDDSVASLTTIRSTIDSAFIRAEQQTGDAN
jgi:hypothetical protein